MRFGGGKIGLVSYRKALFLKMFDEAEGKCMRRERAGNLFG